VGETLTRREFKVMCEIFKAKEQTLRKAMELLINRYYPKDHIIATQDFIYAWGDIPIGLVAHLDTVHRQVPREIFRDQEQHVIWSPQGIGADDRAGVYAIFSLLQDGYRPTVILCTQEEVGGIGADALIAAVPDPKSELSFLLELDRCGRDDMVFYNCDNPDFEDYLRPFSFHTQFGSFSDISVIAPAWGVAAANLSIGYEDEHTFAERLYEKWMLETIHKVRRILEAEAVKPHKFEYVDGRAYPREYDYCFDDFNKYGLSSTSASTKCDCCDQVVPTSSIKSIYEGGVYWYMCPSCLQKYARPCKKCGNWFMPWDPEKNEEEYCEFCSRKEKKMNDSRNL